jgi:hypothetical protein
LLENGREAWFGESHLHLFALQDVVEATELHGPRRKFPGLVLIGSGGAGEGLGFDFRSVPPSVVLVSLVSAGWDDALPQAASFTPFFERLSNGQGFSWAAGYH